LHTINPFPHTHQPIYSHDHSYHQTTGILHDPSPDVTSLPMYIVLPIFGTPIQSAGKKGPTLHS
jgi:hypothetical protein